MPVKITTELPGLDEIILHHLGGDDIKVTWTATADQGTVRIEADEEGSTDWPHSVEAPIEDEEVELADLPSNTKLTVRGRTQTEDTVAGWTTEPLASFYLPLFTRKAEAVQASSPTGSAIQQEAITVSHD